MGKNQDASDDAPPLDEKLQQHLGDKLKLLFAETTQTPIPDRFSALLDQLQQVGVEGVRAGAAAPPSEIRSLPSKAAASATTASPTSASAAETPPTSQSSASQMMGGQQLGNQGAASEASK